MVPLSRYHKLLHNPTDTRLSLLGNRERDIFFYKLRCFLFPLPQVVTLIERGLVGLMRVLSHRQQKQIISKQH